MMPSGHAVFDASPLIVFHQVGYFDLLRRLFQRISVPRAVSLEVAPSLGKLPGWIEERHDPPIPAPLRRLDRGERAAIALALMLSADFIALDDLPGRRVAASFGFTVIGSLGLLVRAKQHGFIRVVRSPMDQMIASGLYVREPLYQEILIAADEVG
jgi:uncharacterized protein